MSFLFGILECAFVYVFLIKYGLTATIAILAFALVVLFDYLLRSEE